jgi:hypothetical protein
MRHKMIQLSNQLLGNETMGRNMIQWDIHGDIMGYIANRT